MFAYTGQGWLIVTCENGNCKLQKGDIFMSLGDIGPIFSLTPIRMKILLRDRIGWVTFTEYCLTSSIVKVENETDLSKLW